MEDLRNDPALRALTAPGDVESALENLPQLRDHRERPALEVLGRPRVQAHKSAGPVHLRPREGQRLGLAAPSRDEQESNDVSFIGRKVAADRPDLLRGRETAPDVALG